jgi:hypothetical protein
LAEIPKAAPGIPMFRARGRRWMSDAQKINEFNQSVT